MDKRTFKICEAVRLGLDYYYMDPDSATVQKSSEPQEKPQEAAPEPPKEETRELAPAFAETAPNCDENGQFSLF